MDISQLQHTPHFPFFTTVGNFIQKKILKHIARPALQNAENKQEGREPQGGGDRPEENLSPGRTVQRLGRNSLHAVYQSHLCGPGNKHWILETLLEERLYHEF